MGWGGTLLHPRPPLALDTSSLTTSNLSPPTVASVASHIKTRAAALAPADKLVVWTVLGLAALGVVAVYSAIAFLAETKSGGDTERFLFRHLTRTGLALVAVGVVSTLDYRRLAAMSKWLLAGALVLLAAVQVSGVVLGGAQRWLEIGGLSFQPSDFAKVALILHVAVLLARKQAYIEELERGFVPLMIWTVPTIALIGMEDLSTAAILSAAVGTMLFVGRVRLLHLSGVAAVGLLAATLFLMASPQRAARVESYLGLKLFERTEEAAVFSSQDEGYQAKQGAHRVRDGRADGRRGRANRSSATSCPPPTTTSSSRSWPRSTASSVRRSCSSRSSCSSSAASSAWRARPPIRSASSSPSA